MLSVAGQPSLDVVAAGLDCSNAAMKQHAPRTGKQVLSSRKHVSLYTCTLSCTLVRVPLTDDIERANSVAEMARFLIIIQVDPDIPEYSYPC